jgi:hypothetical protein
MGLARPFGRAICQYNLQGNRFKSLRFRVLHTPLRRGCDLNLQTAQNHKTTLSIFANFFNRTRMLPGDSNEVRLLTRPPQPRGPLPDRNSLGSGHTGNANQSIHLYQLLMQRSKHQHIWINHPAEYVPKYWLYNGVVHLFLHHSYTLKSSPTAG